MSERLLICSLFLTYVLLLQIRMSSRTPFLPVSTTIHSAAKAISLRVMFDICFCLKSAFNLSLCSVNLTSSTSLKAIPFQALQSHHPSSRYHHQSPEPLQESAHRSPSSTLAPFQYTPDAAVTVNFTKSNSCHVILKLKTPSDFLLLLELRTAFLTWSCVSSLGALYLTTFILHSYFVRATLASFLTLAYARILHWDKFFFNGLILYMESSILPDHLYNSYPFFRTLHFLIPIYVRILCYTLS